MDHYADDLLAVTAHLDLNNAIHVGHSTGGGEVVHYIARHGQSRVSKAAIISAVPPLMVQTPANPKGLLKKVFDDFQVALAANRSQFYRDVAAGPFYNYNKTAKLCPTNNAAEPRRSAVWGTGAAGCPLLRVTRSQARASRAASPRLLSRRAALPAPICWRLSTLADQVGVCTTVLQPLHALIERHVLAAERLHGDDTTVPILAKGKTIKGHIWTYVPSLRRRP
jgi:pimeloyl-ACP methyl ester carboxylesterase